MSRAVQKPLTGPDDAAGTDSRAYLKRRVHRCTFAYVSVGAAVIAWLGLGMPTGWARWKMVPLPLGLISALTLVSSIVVAAVEDMPGPDFKAVLVFWRGKDPLPGCRAFEEASLDRDSRIDRERLLKIVGGSFPVTPFDQNKTWYRLYKALTKDIVVETMHFGYLVYRDLAWLSLVLAALAFASIGLHPQSAARLAIAGGVLIAAYLGFRVAGARRGRRFVNQVLVTVSVGPVKIPRK